MEQIRDGRLNVLVHPSASQEDLPVNGIPDLPDVANTDPFVPQGVDKPQIYAGDVVVGVYDEEIRFAELIYGKIDGGVLIVPLDHGGYEVTPDGQFSSRFYKADEIHIYDGVADKEANWDVEFDESALERPEQGRPR
jgi:hypothetical protein